MTTVALVLFTVVVLAGGTTGVDNWGLAHVMPGARYGSGSGIVTIVGLLRPFPVDALWWSKVLDAYLYPASFFVSILIIVVACAVIARRGQPVAAALWLAAWLGANALELLGKVAPRRATIGVCGLAASAGGVRL